MVVVSTDMQIKLKAVFDSAMGRAADAFSRMTRAKISAKPVMIYLTSVNDSSFSTNRIDIETVLITPVIGDLPGKSFLFFSRSEADVICRSVSGTKTISPLMQESLLKEYDNILSAAFISVMCDMFNISLYGDVPELSRLDARSAEQLIKNYQPNGELSVVCVGGFSSDIAGFAPQFVWKFSSHILNKAESSVKDEGPPRQGK